MSRPEFRRSRPADAQPQLTTLVLRLLIVLLLLGVGLVAARSGWLTDAWNAPPAEVAQPPGEETPPPDADDELEELPAGPLVVPNVTIRDQSGKVLYRGAIDLSGTLQRIEQGRRLQHRNDGAVFQNRERRLPSQPAGYYREWVHPTPGVPGPGPQRVVTGNGQEVYYTPDHYRSFQRIR